MTNSKTSIKINAADLVSKIIETNSNVEVITTNKAQISDLIKGYNLTINSKELENNGNISSLNNINIISDIITSNNIIANNDISITGNQITNNDSIIAGGKVNITATDYLTNNNDILSLVSGASENSLIINALTLNNNKRIAANSILTINANSLNNNTANSLIISGGNSNLNITNLDNNLGEIESKNNLKIRNLTSNNVDAALLLSVSDTNTNISNSGTLKATNSIDIDIGSSDYNIIGKLETDGFVNIQANNITNQADIGAIDYIKIVANDSFTNGINGGDNSNIKIAANNYLDIEANNNINNYAILSAKTILSLKSLNGNINNYDGAELLASNESNPGTSQLILEAINGAINQYSPNSVVVNGDHTITATDYTNTGRIDIAGSLTMNIANNLINEIGALIYAGNHMYLNVANDLTNKTNATIYAENDLFITNRALTTAEQNTLSTLKSEIAATSDNAIIKQKRLEIANIFDNLKINKLENISGNIESYGGDVYIGATTLTNKREYLPTQGAENEVHVWIQGVKHGTLNHHYYRAEKQGGAAVTGLINSTNNLTINASTITNNSASIYAGNDIVLKANSVNNVSNMYRDYVRYRRNDHNTTFGATTYWYTGTTNVNGINYVNRAHTITANIKAGGNFVGVATGDVNNSTTEHTAANFSCTHHWTSYTCHNRVEIPTGTRTIAGVAGAVAEQSSAILSVEDENGQIVNNIDLEATLSSGTITYVLNNSSSLDQNEVTSNLTSSGLLKSNLGNSKISSNITSETLSSNSNLTSNRVTSSVSPTLIDKINGPDNQGMFQKSTNPNGPLFETRSQFVDQSKFFGSDYFYQKIGLNLTDVQTEFEQQNKRLVGDEFFQTKIIEEQLKTIRKNALLLSDSGTNVNTEIQSLLDNAADEYARLGLTANETLTQSQIDNLQKDIVWFETETINGELYVVPKIYLTKATRDSLNNNGSFTTKSTLMAMGDLQLDSNSLVNSGSVIGNNVAISTTNDITNNNFSEVIATNGLNLTSNSGSIVNFSKLKAGGAVSLTAANNIINTSTVKTNAANLLDSDNPAYISNGSASASSGNISSTLFEMASIEAASFTANAGNDFSNYGANITTTSGDLNITAGDDIRIETVELRNRSEYRSKKYTKITDTTTNTSSNITSTGGTTLTTNGSGTDNEAGTSDLGVGSSILVSGSNVSAVNDLNLSANNNAIITNAVNKDYSFEQRTKKGSIKTSRTSRTDYVETAVNSNLTGKNINITTNNNIYVQGSDLNSNFDINTNTGGNTNLTAANDTIITNAILQEYHHTTKEVSNRGVFKGVTAITSAVIDLATVGLNLAIATASPILKNIDDPLQKVLDPVVPDSIADNIDYDKLRNKYKDTVYENQYHNTKVKTTTNNDLVNIVASNVSAGNNLSITSTNNTTLQASNLNSGTADTAGTNSNVTGSTTINTNNLNILAAANYNQTTTKQRTKKTFAIRNNTTGNMVTDYTNSNLTAKNDGFTFNVTNQADIRAKDLTDPTISQPSYVTALKAQVASDKISETNLAIANKHWEDTTRQLTDTAQISVAVAAVAIAILTGGIGSGISGAMMTAAATTAGTTATISASQAGMNADGDFFKQAKDISKITWDDTTSRESVENMAIAAAVAGAATWAVQASGGTTSLEKGADHAVYKPDPELMAKNPEYRAFVEAKYPNYNGVIDPSANNIGMANTTTDMSKIGTPVPDFSTNPTTSSFWDGFAKEGGFISDGANKAGGMNSMSTMHDPWSQNTILGKSPILQLTIPPAIAVQYCATFPAACAAVINKDNLINEQ